MKPQSTPFFYRPKIQSIVWRSLLVLCFFSAAFEFFFVKRYSYFSKEGAQSIDGFFLFYGLMGIFGTLLFILLALVFRRLFQVCYNNDDF